MYYFKIEWLDKFEIIKERGIVAAESMSAAVVKIEEGYGKGIISVTIEPWEDILSVEELKDWLEDLD